MFKPFILVKSVSLHFNRFLKPIKLCKAQFIKGNLFSSFRQARNHKPH